MREEALLVFRTHAIAMLRTLVIFGALAATTDAFMGGAPMALTGRTRSKAVGIQRLAVRMTAASRKADRLNTDDDFLPDNSVRLCAPPSCHMSSMLIDSSVSVVDM